MPRRPDPGEDGWFRGVGIAGRIGHAAHDSAAADADASEPLGPADLVAGPGRVASGCRRFSRGRHARAAMLCVLLGWIPGGGTRGVSSGWARGGFALPLMSSHVGSSQAGRFEVAAWLAGHGNRVRAASGCGYGGLGLRPSGVSNAVLHLHMEGARCCRPSFYSDRLSVNRRRTTADRNARALIQRVELAFSKINACTRCDRLLKSA